MRWPRAVHLSKVKPPRFVVNGKFEEILRGRCPGKIIWYLREVALRQGSEWYGIRGRNDKSASTSSSATSVGESDDGPVLL